MNDTGAINKADNRSPLWHLAAVVLLAVFTVTVFIYTVHIRRPWFDTLSETGHQWQTASTVLFAKNWYREGIFKLRFAQLQAPLSVENPSIDSREVYMSYPPGAVLPVFILAKIAGREPSFPEVMKYDLANHLLIALFISFIAYLFLIQLKIHPLNAFLFALMPPAVVLLMPGPVYYFQKVFYTDEAALLPYALVVFIELLRDSCKGRRMDKLLNIILGLILFYGFITDWLFVFLAMTLFIKRVLSGEIPVNKGLSTFIKNSSAIWAPALIAFSLFMAQVAYFNFWQGVFDKFLFRSGLAGSGMEQGPSFSYKFWNVFITDSFGRAGMGLLLGSIGLFVVLIVSGIIDRVRGRNYTREKFKVLWLTGMLILPCLLQVYALRQHSYIHDFAALKFIMPLSLIPFVIAPYLLIMGCREKIPQGIKGIFIILLLNLAVLVPAGLYIAGEHPHYRKLYPVPSPAYKNLARYFKNIKYNDIIFSPDFQVPLNPPHAIAYTMKRVYPYYSKENIGEKVKDIREPYNVVIMRLDKDLKKQIDRLRDLKI